MKGPDFCNVLSTGKKPLVKVCKPLLEWDSIWVCVCAMSDLEDTKSDKCHFAFLQCRH